MFDLPAAAQRICDSRTARDGDARSVFVRRALLVESDRKSSARGACQKRNRHDGRYSSRCAIWSRAAWSASSSERRRRSMILASSYASVCHCTRHPSCFPVGALNRGTTSTLCSRTPMSAVNVMRSRCFNGCFEYATSHAGSASRMTSMLSWLAMQLSVLRFALDMEHSRPEGATLIFGRQPAVDCRDTAASIASSEDSQRARIHAVCESGWAGNAGYASDGEERRNRVPATDSAPASGIPPCGVVGSVRKSLLPGPQSRRWLGWRPWRC